MLSVRAKRLLKAVYWGFLLSFLGILGIVAAESESGFAVAALFVVGVPIVWYSIRPRGRTILVLRALKFVRITNALVGAALAAAVFIGVPLAALYFLVRFVKWAWTD